MSEATLPRKPDETTLRKAAGVLFLMGLGLLYLILKMETPSGTMFWIGSSIWIFWLARLCLPGMPQFLRRTGWAISLVWHIFWLILTGPLFLLHPIGWGVLLHCAIAILVSMEGIKNDRPQQLLSDFSAG